MKVVLVVNDAPYGSEKPFNALRLALALLVVEPGAQVRIFLLGDAVTGALPGQVPSQGGYNFGQMLAEVIEKGGEVRACVTCAKTRGLEGLALVPGVKITTMNQLARWVAEADRVLVF